MSIYKQQGVIKEIPPVETGQNKKGETWTKQVIPVSFSVDKKDGSSFERVLAVEAFNKQLPPLQAGQTVEVEFTVSSNEYKGRYYTNLSLMSINVLSGATPQQTATQSANGDLPF